MYYCPKFEYAIETYLTFIGFAIRFITSKRGHKCFFLVKKHEVEDFNVDITFR
jgi:hypothetical protein